MLLVGVLLGYFLVLAGFLLLWHEKVYKEHEEPTFEPIEEEQPDAWQGISEARRRHPSPEAHSELDSLEVDGPVHVHGPERVVKVR